VISSQLGDFEMARTSQDNKNENAPKAEEPKNDGELRTADEGNLQNARAEAPEQPKEQESLTDRGTDGAAPGLSSADLDDAELVSVKVTGDFLVHDPFSGLTVEPGKNAKVPMTATFENALADGRLKKA
jgi:hypothetical protein